MAIAQPIAGTLSLGATSASAVQPWRRQSKRSAIVDQAHGSPPGEEGHAVERLVELGIVPLVLDLAHDELHRLARQPERLQRPRPAQGRAPRRSDRSPAG
jgi:hypothetical protein